MGIPIAHKLLGFAIGRILQKPKLNNMLGLPTLKSSGTSLIGSLQKENFIDRVALERRQETRQRLSSNANTREGRLERLQWNAPPEVNRAIAEKEWYFVSSSNIDAIKYDIDTSVLTVKFLTGRIYEYLDVPYELALRLFTAVESHGKFFWANIRNTYYSPQAKNNS